MSMNKFEAQRKFQPIVNEALLADVRMRPCIVTGRVPTKSKPNHAHHHLKSQWVRLDIEENLSPLDPYGHINYVESPNKKQLISWLAEYGKLDLVFPDGKNYFPYFSELKKLTKQRTPAQNRAIHLFFTQLANELNDAGLDMRKTLKPGVDIPWNPKTVKDFLWRPIQGAVVNKDSTTKLSTIEIDKVYDILMKHLGEKHGIDVPFPSLESLYERSKNGLTNI